MNVTKLLKFVKYPYLHIPGNHNILKFQKIHKGEKFL